MIKPVVHYSKSEDVRFHTYESGAEVAFVVALDHHRFPSGTDVRTSQVVKKNHDGSFETLNTIYVPFEGEKSE